MNAVRSNHALESSGVKDLLASLLGYRVIATYPGCSRIR